MKTFVDDAKKVATFSAPNQGIFSIADIKNLLNETDGLKLNRRIRRLLQAGELTRFERGFYATRNATLEAMSARLREKSYISLASALSRHLMIGTVPAKTVYAVSVGRPQTISGPMGRIVYVSSRPELIFGFETTDGVSCATPEKAVLDMLYYYQKGRRYYFDIFTDVNLSCVKTAVIRSYLPHYNNPRFVAFVQGYLDGRLS